jgi:hypothetical protein
MDMNLDISKDIPIKDHDNGYFKYIKEDNNICSGQIVWT